MTPTELDDLLDAADGSDDRFWPEQVRGLIDALLQAWADLAAEREACARYFDDFFLRDGDKSEWSARAIASAIRNRGNK